MEFKGINGNNGFVEISYWNLLDIEIKGNIHDIENRVEN